MPPLFIEARNYDYSLIYKGIYNHFINSKEKLVLFIDNKKFILNKSLNISVLDNEKKEVVELKDILNNNKLFRRKDIDFIIFQNKAVCLNNIFINSKKSVRVVFVNSVLVNKKNT